MNLFIYFISLVCLRFTRLLVFTLEVAIGTMPRNAEQFVLLFDASKQQQLYIKLWFIYFWSTKLWKLRRHFCLRCTLLKHAAKLIYETPGTQICRRTGRGLMYAQTMSGLPLKCHIHGPLLVSLLGVLSGIEACHVIYSPSRSSGQICTQTSLNFLILTQMVPRILLFCIAKCQHHY